jgi:hypothetical protein
MYRIPANIAGGVTKHATRLKATDEQHEIQTLVVSDRNGSYALAFSFLLCSDSNFMRFVSFCRMQQSLINDLFSFNLYLKNRYLVLSSSLSH